MATEEDLSREQVFEKIETVKNSLQTVDAEKLRKNLFLFMDLLSRKLLSQKLVNQTGGIKITQPLDSIPSSIVQVQPPFDPSKISIDETYYGVKKYLAELDDSNRALVRELGPISFEKDVMVGPFPPVLPVAVPVAPRLAYGLLNTLMEALRLLTTFGPLESSFLRMIMSIATGVLEIARGEWRDGVLSFLGVFGSFMVYAGTIGKSFRLVYGFINPTLQDRLEDTLFESGKSLFVGMWLWGLSISAPEVIRQRLTDLHNTLVEAVEGFNAKLDTIEDAAQSSVKGLGLRVEFGRIDPTKIPSFDDVQNMTTILNMPEIMCLDATQKVLEPLLKMPVTRIILELMSVPTTDEAREEKCKGMSGDIMSVAKETLGPRIVEAKKEESKEEAKNTKKNKGEEKEESKKNTKESKEESEDNLKKSQSSAQVGGRRRLQRSRKTRRRQQRQHRRRTRKN